MGQKSCTHRNKAVWKMDTDESTTYSSDDSGHSFRRNSEKRNSSEEELKEQNRSKMDSKASGTMNVLDCKFSTVESGVMGIIEERNT